MALWIRNKAKDTARNLSRLWPGSYPEFERLLRGVLPDNADEKTIHTHACEVAADNEHLLRPVAYHGGKDVHRMSALELHELAHQINPLGKKN